MKKKNDTCIYITLGGEQIAIYFGFLLTHNLAAK